MKRLGIDDISLLKGHGDFVMLLYDIDAHEIVDVLPDVKKRTLTRYPGEHKDDMFADLEVVSIDMCKHYHAAVNVVFPHVDVVADRFHVESALDEALDDCPRDVQRKIEDPDKRREWKRSYRHVVLRSYEKQCERPGGMEELNKVPGYNSELEKLYWLKEEFRAIYELEDYEQAKVELNPWIGRATYLGSKYLEPFIQAVRRWKEAKLGYIKQMLDTRNPIDRFHALVLL